MTNFKYYSNAIPYSISGTPFAAVFDAADGSSSNPEWYTVMGLVPLHGLTYLKN